MQIMTARSGQGGRIFLFLLGFVAILMGIGVALYSVLELRPRVAVMSDQLHATLSTLDRASQALNGGSRLLNGPMATFEAGQALIRQLPETLVTLKGSLLEASNALVATGKTAKQTTHGVTGLVAPKPQLGATNVYLQDTAEQLRLLAVMVDHLAKSSRGVVAGTQSMLQEFARVRAGLGPAAALVGDARGRLRAIDQALTRLDLPGLTMFVGIGCAGLCEVLGVLCITLGQILWSVSRLGPLTAAEPRYADLEAERIRRQRGAA